MPVKVAEAPATSVIGPSTSVPLLGWLLNTLTFVKVTLPALVTEPLNPTKPQSVGQSTETAMAGIRVNAVAPGSTRTKLIEQGLRDGSIKSDWQIERIPMGRLAEPREIADPVVYLASDRASYITGQTIVVDGGWTIQGMVHIADWLKPELTG